MTFHAKFLCNYVEILHTNQGRTCQGFFFNFNLLLYGIQDGFVFSFRKKEIYIFIFSWKLRKPWRDIFTYHLLLTTYYLSFITYYLQLITYNLLLIT